MRLKLKKGKQKELISLAKANKTWNHLGSELGVNPNYLCKDIYNEKRLLSAELFQKLSNMTKKDFSEFVQQRFEDNWGRQLGGKRSGGGRTKKKIIKPEKSEELAELIGIILGDGSLYFNKSWWIYALKISGNHKERPYICDFVKPLLDKIFKVDSKIEVKPSELFVTVYSKEMILRLEELGLFRGNKVKNNVGIPLWIKEDKEFLKSCIRGLIDTDGSVFRMSNKDPHLARICFTNKAQNLLTDVREGLLRLGFSPSKIIKGDQFFISRKLEIRKYAEEIRFNNPKHSQRLSNIAP